MKSPADVVADVRRRLERTWAADVTGVEESWPHRFPLGALAKGELEAGWQAEYQPLIRTWRDFAHGRPVQLRTEARRVYTTVQDIPTHVEIATAEDAAAIAEADWAARLGRGRERASLLAHQFPEAGGLARIVRAADEYTDTDFSLLLKVAAWFTANDAIGFTPRQVPIPGIHAKWLNTHQQLILTLTSRDTLGLLPSHPSRIHFTYLDPDHRATGARRHDCATVGDAFTPPYAPQIVIISENKDTAIHFPPLPGGIAVEGGGFGGKAAASFGWLTGARHLLYWGDIDAYGFEILNGWREDGVPAVNILMDEATYDAYEPFGTNTDRNGHPLKAGVPKPVPHLTDQERSVYQRLLDAQLRGHRRIEQERMPLQVAVDSVLARIG
jgi:hypothetical protein